MDRRKKGFCLLVIGMICLLIGFIWMVLSETTIGLYLILAAVGGALIFEGLVMVKGGRRQ